MVSTGALLFHEQITDTGYTERTRRVIFLVRECALREMHVAGAVLVMPKTTGTGPPHQNFEKGATGAVPNCGYADFTTEPPLPIDRLTPSPSLRRCRCFYCAFSHTKSLAMIVCIAIIGRQVRKPANEKALASADGIG